MCGGGPRPSLHCHTLVGDGSRQRLAARRPAVVEPRGRHDEAAAADADS